MDERTATVQGGLMVEVRDECKGWRGQRRRSDIRGAALSRPAVML